MLEEYNYDPWGRRRNQTNWSYSNVSVPTYTNRGFTGHEHLDMFNLIHMNGRIYDPEIARFLSPDPFIQDPYNLLNYNRYSYCMNNPLKFTDPSGYIKEYPGLPSIFYNLHWGDFSQQRSQYNNYVEKLGSPGSGGAKGALVIGKKKETESIGAAILCAMFLRNSPVLGIIQNPFYGAEAIMFDGGFTISGSEFDGGFVFILAGTDIGMVRTFSELAGGIGSDAGVGGELTRIDYIGDINDFSLGSINGPRDKFYAGVEVSGEGLSVGGAISYGKTLSGGIVLGTTIQTSFGASLMPFIYGGYNYGTVKVNE